VLNLAPAYHLDGEHALRAYLALFFPTLSGQMQDKLATGIFRGVSILFIVNIIVSVGVMYL